MANLEKLYQSVAEQIIQRCHGAIKITKHGKIIEVYDTRRHIWSDGLAGLIIKEESKNANLRDWEVARCIRPRIISMLLEDKKGLLSTRLAPDSAENQTRKRLSKKKFTVKKPTTKKPVRRKSNQ
jgi:topoisomerase IA-like protein